MLMPLFKICCWRKFGDSESFEKNCVYYGVDSILSSSFGKLKTLESPEFLSEKEIKLCKVKKVKF